MPPISPDYPLMTPEAIEAMNARHVHGPEKPEPPTSRARRLGRDRAKRLDEDRAHKPAEDR